jgi:hypothetical protein
MAGVTTANFDAVLKDLYNDEVLESLVNSTKLRSKFQRGTFKFEGRRVVYSVHVGRNESVEAIAPGGVMPVADRQKYETGYLNVGHVAGTGQLDRDVIKRAPSKGAGAFLDALKSEMDGLERDFRVKEDNFALFGGQCKGFLNEKKATNATAGAFVGGGASGAGAATTWEYSGDFTPFLNVNAANTDTWVRIKVIRLDTYAEVVPAGVLPGLFVTGYNQAAGTLNLQNVANAAGQVFTTTVASGVTQGAALALLLHETQLQDGGGNNFGTIDAKFALEPQGLFNYVGLPTFLGIDRTTATGYETLQAVGYTQAQAGADARAAITMVRFQELLDQIATNAEDAEPNLILCNTKFRSVLMGVITATVRLDARGGAKGKATDAGADAGMMTMNGYELYTSINVPRGMVFAVDTTKIKMAELDKLHFCDEGGGIIQRVPGFDKLTFEMVHRYTLVNTQPRCLGILCGITY